MEPSEYNARSRTIAVVAVVLSVVALVLAIAPYVVVIAFDPPLPRVEEKK